MLTAHHLNKSYGIQPILQDISFSVSEGEHIGLIGPNGCGKTTLLRILADLDRPDSGTVIATRPDLRTGYLAQGMDFDSAGTLQEILQPDGTVSELEAELSRLALALSSRPEDSSIQKRYDEVLHHLSESDPRAEGVLESLGLGGFPPDTPVAHLSGGQKTRLMLARVLLQQPHLLLLDEPTNHLDIAMLEWLEGWINRFPGAAVIVSHDRAFLDNTVTSILEIDPLSHTAKAYPGNYSDYISQKITEREKQAQDYQDQQEELAQLRAAAAHIRGLTRMKKGGKADGGDKFAKGFFGNRATKNVAGRAKHIEARIERILAEEKVDKPRRSWQMKLDFGEPENYSKNVVSARGLAVGYPPEPPLLEGLDLHIRHGDRIALTGPNGSGKTTLVRTLIGRLEPLAGSMRMGPAVRLGYMAQEQEMLDLALSALGNLQKIAPFNETEARHFLHFFLFSGDDPLRPAADLSFGERARLQLAVLVAQGSTFLVLDEPINHLDIPSRARFELALSRFKGAVLAVVHDRYFIEQYASTVWSIEDGRIIKW